MKMAGKVKWTKEQLEAINEKGSNFLVAAAAGAGKTAVLVERIIQRVTDEKDPVDIDRLLVVTFTNAAATESSHGNEGENRGRPVPSLGTGS